MLFHAVLFCFKDNVPDTRRDNILRLSREVLPKIPGVMNLMAGKTINPNNEYDHAITMYFEDEAALQEYRDHPAHVHFRDVEFFPYVDKKIGLDYSDA